MSLPSELNILSKNLIISPFPNLNSIFLELTKRRRNRRDKTLLGIITSNEVLNVFLQKQKGHSMIIIVRSVH